MTFIISTPTPTPLKPDQLTLMRSSGNLTSVSESLRGKLFKKGRKRAPVFSFLAVLVTFSVLAGCTTATPDGAFGEVRESVEPRLEKRVHWARGGSGDAEAEGLLHELLAEEEITADEAVQIALLNNRRLQANYADLGIAQADLVQAGLLGNPIFSASAAFPLNDGSAEWTLGLTQPFLDIFLMPGRRRMAQAELDAAQDRLAATILEHAYETHLAFLRVQAEQEKLQLYETMLEASALTHEFAERLHEAGNITDLDLARERASHEHWQVRFIRAEERLVLQREEANWWMGRENSAAWSAAGSLAEIPAEEADLTDLERRALDANLFLEAERRRMEAAAEAIGLANAQAVVPSLELGAEAEREDGNWKVGPEIALGLPIFDRGQARRQRARTELGRSQDLYLALSAEVRIQARMARKTLESSRERAMRYRDRILPLRQEILDESLLQYNAMTLGPADLLLARRQQAEAGEQYVEAVFDYWSAHAQIGRLLAGHASSSSQNRRSEINTNNDFQK